jgi:hypothetical protein
LDEVSNFDTGNTEMRYETLKQARRKGEKIDLGSFSCVNQTSPVGRFLALVKNASETPLTNAYLTVHWSSSYFRSAREILIIL